MRVAQYVRIFGLLLVLGLIGCVFGCSGGSDSSSPNKEIVKSRSGQILRRIVNRPPGSVASR